MLKRENSPDENEKNSKRSKYLDTLVESVKVEIKEDEENQTSKVKEADEEEETYEEDESLNRSDQILPDNIEKAVTNLKQLLSSPIFLGKYSVTGEATQLKSLELELYSKKLGLIRLPIEDNLTLETADLIPSQFEIKNSIWEDKLQELVDHITTEFGYSELKVKPELEKIVLNKKGNDLLKYCEISEKNLFARLLIQLPSVFKGGELKVYNNETLTRFDFGQSNNKCACSIHFAAFYADLEYEFLEVTNGYQLILAYSLYSDKISDYYSFKNKQSNEISICLKEISLLNNPISIQLEHKYRSKHFYKKISKIDLKGIDRSRFNLLKSANACLEIEDQFSFFFVKAEKHFETENPADSGSECGRTDYFPRDLNSDDEIHPKKTKDNEYYLRGSSIDSWFDNQGNIILNTSGISFSFFSKFIDLKNDTDRGIYRWRYGNNRYYHKFLLTFWPKKLDIKFMSQISFEQAIDLISDDFLNNSQYLEILETFLNKLDTSVIYDDFDFGYNNYELIDQKHYDRLISILKTINNPKFDKIFIDKIKFFKSESLLTNVVYKLWKDSNFKITLFKEIIINLLSKVNIDEEFLLQKDDSWEKERMARYRNCEDEIHDRFDKKNIYSFNQYNQYHDKQIEILNELNDLEVTKVYIEKFMRIYCKNKIYEKFKNIRDESCDNFLKSAINLIKIYEWKPIENLFEFLRPVSADNIEYNCTLIKGFLQFDQKENAFSIVKSNLLPILQQTDEFNKLKDIPGIYIQIFKIIFSFENLLIEMRMFKDLIINQEDQYLLKDLLDDIFQEKDFSIDKLSNPILEMIDHRLVYLKSVQDVLKTDWKIRTNYPKKRLIDSYFKGYEKKMIDNFLNSDEEKMIYKEFNIDEGNMKAIFRTITEAKNFVEINSCFMRDNYSVEMTAFPKKKGDDPYVVFVKTNKYFESIRVKEKIEIEFLENILKDSISTM